MSVSYLAGVPPVTTQRQCLAFSSSPLPLSLPPRFGASLKNNEFADRAFISSLSDGELRRPSNSPTHPPRVDTVQSRWSRLRHRGVLDLKQKK